MNKTAIKNFAIWARNKLIADISYRAGLMGITADGIKTALVQSTGTTEFYDIGTAEPYSISGDAVKQRKHLVELIQRKEKETNYKTAYKYILEEVAYTWFNRLIAVRFMEVNDYLPSHMRVLSSDSRKIEPDLVTNPFDAGLSFTSSEEQTIYQLKQENKIDELFRILFIKQCNTLNENLPALFEKTSDYTELLLNLSIIDQDGVVYHLVHDIPEEDFNIERGGQVEIIGWLYQYYNTEPKNEAFAKKGKVTKEEVPAVTQLFTPDWIVRYMVENSLGRLWVEGHPNDELKARWKYYLEEAEQEPEVQAKLAEIRKEYAKLNPEDIKVIDPCMGSGHILVYAFDVLMQIYESAGYGQRDAARSILENNLYGLDIDDRAFQMAYFAIMMKARQYNRRILNGEYKPNVYSIQESNGINRNQLKYFGARMSETEKNNAIEQMRGLLDTFYDAKEYGSILTVEQYDWDFLIRFVSCIEMIGQQSFEAVGLDETAEQLKQIIAQGKILAQKYHVVTTNPPYLSEMNTILQKYVKKYYPNSKNDLCTVFIEKCISFAVERGYVGMITQNAFMFLSRYEKMRNELLTYNFVNMAHLGSRAFDAIGGEVVQTTTFVLRNTIIKRYNCLYNRLVDYQSESGKEDAYLKGYNRIICPNERFSRIPRNPMTYWVSDKALDIFNEARLDTLADPRVGMFTTDNDRYLREWWELNFNDIGFNFSKKEDAYASEFKWFPYNKGGGFRRWYGMIDLVVYWYHGGEEIRKLVLEKYPYLNGNYDFVLKTSNPYCKPGITWSGLTSGANSFRLCGDGFFFDTNKGAMLFERKINLYYLLALLNSHVAQFAMSLLNSTISLQISDVAAVPVIYSSENAEKIERLSAECVSICKEDWDSTETSWDFEEHPFIKIASGVENSLLEDVYREWEKNCRDRFDKLRDFESELNTLFISIYGLEDELDSTIPDDEISVSLANRKRDIKSLLSYAVGCMLGRYSLSQKKLVYGGGEWHGEQYQLFTPDDDNIIPITDEEYLEDDIVSRLCEWLKINFGKKTLEQNLDFIASNIGKKGNASREIIRYYFLNDFFKDHCTTYSATASGKRPIYWLFDSGKQNGFKALIYLHRYNANTIGNLRIDYLHRMQRIYESEIERMQDMINHSSNRREVTQATKRREKLIKQLKECREYDEKLAHLALSRIELDLDDGVKKNYRKIQTANDGKFYEVLADSKNIMSKE